MKAKCKIAFPLEWGRRDNKFVIEKLRTFTQSFNYLSFKINLKLPGINLKLPGINLKLPGILYIRLFYIGFLILTIFYIIIISRILHNNNNICMYNNQQSLSIPTGGSHICIVLVLSVHLIKCMTGERASIMGHPWRQEAHF